MSDSHLSPSKLESGDGAVSEELIDLDSVQVLRRLRLRLIWALLLIGILAATNYAISSYILYSKEDVAQSVNISGRQRMLSQRISGLAQEVSINVQRGAVANPSTLNDLRAAISQMSAAHQSLAYGDISLSVSPPSALLRKLYFSGTPSLDERVLSFLAVAERIYQAGPTGQVAAEDVAAISAAARAPLLSALDEVVLTYQKEVEAALRNVHLVQSLLLAVMVIGLGLVATLVFLPMIGIVRQNMADLNAKRREAEKASLAKSQFLSSMSHEIRTPMNGIISMSELLQDGVTDPNHNRYATIVKRSAASLLAILNDILDVSKMEAGFLSLEYVPVNLHQLIQETVEAFGSQSAEKGLSLEMEVADDLNRSLKGDPTRLRQILFNLIGNALKFTEAGTVTVRASTVAADDLTLTVRIEVEDTGIGFDADQARHLFDAFAQADQTTTRKFGGTGLGLAIVRQLVDAMGGKAEATGEPGVGAVFRVDVPLQVGSDSDAAEREQANLSQAAEKVRIAGEWYEKAILVADDNVTNRELMGFMLAALGCQNVTFATDGVEAIAEAEKQRFAIVFMDSQMPNMDGIEATRTIRNSDSPNARTPIIAVTADALDGARERYLSEGFDEYLAKPIVPANLSETLQRFIAS